MRIEYRNKFADIVLFNTVHQFLSLPMQGVYLGLGALIFYSDPLGTSLAVTIVAALFWHLASWVFDSGLTLTIVAALCWYLALWAFQIVFNVVYLFSRRNGSVLTDHAVEVQADALLEETRFNKSLFYWPGVVRAVSWPGFVAIYVTPHIAHVIPNRAFRSKQERLQFINLVREKMRAAGGKV